MNLLPLVLAFLLVFAMSSAKLFQDYHAAYWESWGFSAHMRAERLWRNHREKKLCDLHAPPKEGTTAAASGQKNIGFISWRDKVTLASQGALHLGNLLKGEIPRLQKVAENLLHELYGHTLFFQEAKKLYPHLEKELFEILLENGEGASDAVSMMKAFPSDHPLASVFYQMMRGTNHYDLLKKEGYPPFEHYFSLDKGAKPIAFPFASRPLLNAAFNAQFADLIINREKKLWEKDHKRHPMTKKVLTELLSSQFPGKIDQSEILGLFHFSRQKGTAKKLVAVEKESQITVRREWEGSK